MRTGRMSVAALALVAAAACGGGSGASSPAAPTVTATPQPAATATPVPSPSPTAVVASTTDLTGTWTGGGTGGGRRFTLTWVLRQSGSSVTGTGRSTDQDGFTTGESRLTGTVSGSSFTFSDVYPQGALANAACGETDTGTLTITAGRMDGAFRSESTCGRVEVGVVTLTR